MFWKEGLFCNIKVGLMGEESIWNYIFKGNNPFSLVAWMNNKNQADNNQENMECCGSMTRKGRQIGYFKANCNYFQYLNPSLQHIECLQIENCKLHQLEYTFGWVLATVCKQCSQLFYPLWFQNNDSAWGWGQKRLCPQNLCTWFLLVGFR